MTHLDDPTSAPRPMAGGPRSSPWRSSPRRSSDASAQYRRGGYGYGRGYGVVRPPRTTAGATPTAYDRVYSGVTATATAAGLQPGLRRLSTDGGLVTGLDYGGLGYGGRVTAASAILTTAIGLGGTRIGPRASARSAIRSRGGPRSRPDIAGPATSPRIAGPLRRADPIGAACRVSWAIRTEGPWTRSKGLACDGSDSDRRS